MFENFLRQEKTRIKTGINLIASENYASKKVLNLCGSIFSAKYAEGLPGNRYYSGCKIVDEVELRANKLCLDLFGAEHVNLQPHSGSQANQAIMQAFLSPGDTVLSMAFSAGGHLTHGHPLNFSGKNYNFIFYGVDPKTERLNYDELNHLAQKHKPKMIIAGASAYPFLIDFEKISKIAKTINSIFVVDMAHIAGLVAAKLIPSPIPLADVVSSTTHKTLRGPRGGMILSKKEFATKINRSVMPGLQGGPHMNLLAAKGQAFWEASQTEFIQYQKQTLANSKALTKTLQKNNFKIVGDGTETHLLLIDLLSSNLPQNFGSEAEKTLEAANIFVNRNLIPFDQASPLKTSGIRLGTPAITTLGANEKDLEQIANLILLILKNPKNTKIKKNTKSEIKILLSKITNY